MFKLFKRNKVKSELTEAQMKWNKMWKLWAEGKIESPIEELMTYQGEINNGGHSQYFSNTENVDDVQKCIDTLYMILPKELKDNLENAYVAYLRLEQDETDENAERILEECDSIFYDNERYIIKYLEEYSEKNIKLE